MSAKFFSILASISSRTSVCVCESNSKMHFFFLLPLIFFFHHCSSTSSSSSSIHSPDHFLSKSLRENTPDEYFEVTKPLETLKSNPSCSLHLFQHDFANTYGSPPASAHYSPPPNCPPPWTHVVLEFHASCRGEQYDRIAGIWLQGVELLRTSTPEPTESGIFWNIRKDVTRYSSLLQLSNLTLTVMLENIVNDIFTGIYHVNISLLYYYGGGAPATSSSLQLNNKTPANLILPVANDNGEQEGFWFRIQNEANVATKHIQIPLNTYRVELEISLSFHGDDEFWYSNPPNAYIEHNNLTTGRGNGAFRQVFVTIDGVLVGSVEPFPVIFTGGINPLFWEPVVAIGAFQVPSYDIDLSPFLGLLLDGKTHLLEVGVRESISFWLVDANLHLWLDSSSPTVVAKSFIYPTPPLSIKRESRFENLDGLFKIYAKRKIEFYGWVSSSFGNSTTYISHEFDFISSIEFKNHGQFKEVKQKIKVKVEMKVESDSGELLARKTVRRKYPLYVLTSTKPGLENNTYLLITNVSHALTEKSSLVLPSGNFFRFVANNQVSGGWMLVLDHSVLSGDASTHQTLLDKDNAGCYYRTVSAGNGTLLEDKSTLDCAPSW